MVYQLSVQLLVLRPFQFSSWYGFTLTVHGTYWEENYTIPVGKKSVPIVQMRWVQLPMWVQYLANDRDIFIALAA